jgi:hypothetical protein
VGELQEAIVAKQFEASRDGDRFFYLNDPALQTIEQKYGISYKHSLGELISADAGVPRSSLQSNVFFASTPVHHIYKPEYKKWVVSGSLLTDKHDGAAVTLPQDGTFTGSGEINHETGAGSISGTISDPRFTSAVDLGGSQGEQSVEMTLTPVGAVTASTAGSNGLEALSLPLMVNIGFTKIGNDPIDCETAEPVVLNSSDTLDLEELLTKGWQFTGTTVIPEIKCREPGHESGVQNASLEGSALGGALSSPFSATQKGGHEDPSMGQVLSSAFSGSESPFSLAITAPMK